VLDGDPATIQKGHSPQFSAHIHCDQTAGWIKMPLGMDVGLCPGDCVRWVWGEGTQPSSPRPKKGTASSQFLAHVYYGQTAGWIKVPLGMEVGLGPGGVVLMGTKLPLKGAQLPQFSAHVCRSQVA